MAEVAQVFLEREGYEVTVALGGAAGLARYAEAAGAFDLVVLDWSMPDLDGGEVLRRLRAEGDAPPVLVASGFRERMAEVLREHEGPRPEGFVAKPYEPEDLLAAVRSALAEGHR